MRKIKEVVGIKNHVSDKTFEFIQLELKHRGEILKKAISDSGMAITEIARRWGKTARTIYNKFDERNIPLDELLEIGKIISYDFSKEIPELKKLLQEPSVEYFTADSVKDRYIKLLEDHNRLLSEKLTGISDLNQTLQSFQNELIETLKEFKKNR